MTQANRAPARWAVVVAVLLSVSVSGCTGGSRSGSDQPGVQNRTSVAGSAGVSPRVPIGSSSEDDIAAALRANGVEDPQKWAQVILNNAPYPADDPNMTKLRQVLQQQNADPATIEKIVNTVQP
jgi:hypothetical protein